MTQTEKSDLGTQVNVPVSTLQVLKVISDDVILDMFNEIEKDPKTKDGIMQTLELSHKEYYSRVQKLVKVGLIRRRQRAFVLTPFGKLVYEAKSKIAKAARESWQYEGAVRRSYVVDSDRFSLYVEKLKTSADVIAIIPAGIAIITFSAIFSIGFNSWMVLVLSRYQDMNMHVFYRSVKDLIGIITLEREKMKNMIRMFIITSIISVLEFTLPNISVLPAPSELNLYIFQFVISGVIELAYFPFFLTCLYLILYPELILGN